MNNYCVYEHISPNGKRYIGITSQAPSRRWRTEGKGYRQNKHFSNAIAKYGWDNFEHKILFVNLTKEEACQKEIELIAFYRSDEFEFGYNRSVGGEAGELIEDSKKQISESVKKLWDDPEYRKHMSEVHKGKATTKGYKHTAETKAKMSEIVKERMKSETYKARLSESAKKRSSTPEGKAQAIQRGKAVWANPESRAKIIESKKGNHYRAKKVICIETGEVFISVSEAANSINATREAIGRVCRGLSKTSGGKHWRFADEI